MDKKAFFFSDEGQTPYDKRKLSKKRGTQDEYLLSFVPREK